MVAFKGELTLIRDGIDYGIYNKDRHINITEKFHDNLLHTVKLSIRIDGVSFINAEGVLRKVKNRKIGLYDFKLGKINIDEILWNNVGNKIEMGWEIIKEY